MASNATSTYERNLVVVEIVGVCRLYCVNTAIATVCLHKTTKEWFRPIQVSSVMLLAPPAAEAAGRDFVARQSCPGPSCGQVLVVTSAEAAYQARHDSHGTDRRPVSISQLCGVHHTALGEHPSVASLLDESHCLVSRQLESLVPGVGSDLYCSRYSVCHSIPPGSKSFDGCPILCPGAGIDSRVVLRWYKETEMTSVGGPADSCSAISSRQLRLRTRSR